MDNIKTTNSCRLCDSTDIIEILNFSNVPLANNLRDSADSTGEFRAPLRVFQCKNCGSHQLFDEVAPDILFKNYNYSSPPNLQKHFAEYADTTTRVLPIKKNDLIVGIGGNNGLLEVEYKKLGFDNIINIEPAGNIAKISEGNGIETINEFFTPNLAERIYKYDYVKAKLITCNNCFAHIPDLNEIVEGIKILLDPQGYFVFENAYWLNTILNLDVGQVYAEHIYYHSIKPLKQFFNKHGLTIAEVELNNVQMGSFRIYVTWTKNCGYQSSSVNNLIKLEEDFGLYKEETYSNLLNVKLHESHVNLLEQLSSNRPGKIALYGVPAKIVLLIQYFGLEKYIDYAVEESSLKVGKFVPGTKIEIKSREFWVNDDPATTIIGAYNFANDIKKKNYDYYGKWIIPFE